MNWTWCKSRLLNYNETNIFDPYHVSTTIIFYFLIEVLTHLSKWYLMDLQLLQFNKQIIEGIIKRYPKKSDLLTFTFPWRCCRQCWRPCQRQFLPRHWSRRKQGSSSPRGSAKFRIFWRHFICTVAFLNLSAYVK